ncbi:MAG: hypothetical protein OJF59_001362 [Cytophagales bacterium]|nr:MAG: hypothetical protein OJF59_001362 [Cytophagales bacterium]
MPPTPKKSYLFFNSSSFFHCLIFYWQTIFLCIVGWQSIIFGLYVSGF